MKDDLIFEVLRQAAEGELPQIISGDRSERSLAVARLVDLGSLDADDITGLDVVDRKNERSFINPRITNVGRAKLKEHFERRHHASWRGRLSRFATWLGTQATTIIVSAISGAITAWIVLRFING